MRHGRHKAKIRGPRVAGESTLGDRCLRRQRFSNSKKSANGEKFSNRYVTSEKRGLERKADEHCEQMCKSPLVQNFKEIG
ncbi:hypothetical protein NPIL_363991 [Nephila pilipes]|uniref:Uncharacterized protein n=1 Tax=Nephila pilipes TaxID=299642 RepID=A0A8X6M8R5_NEPPI|nr:hypothetical protein NPIL_363991 [Nephila pilipes]